jgi:hypothetical protein
LLVLPAADALRAARGIALFIVKRRSSHGT